MGAWLQQRFVWHGLTSRDDYRRWLPLIVPINLAELWAVYEFGARGRVNLSDFGLAGVVIFAAFLPFFIGWFFLTARRFRAANLSRGWLAFAVFTINIPLGDFHLNISILAAFLLTVVAALVPDQGRASAA